MNPEINYEVDSKVKIYSQSVVQWMREFSPEIEFDVSADEITSIDGTEIANKILIVSDVGAVVIFPHFNKQTAVAAIINIGLVDYLHQEGFEEEHIMQNEPIYSKLMEDTEESHRLLGYYLTNKIAAEEYHA
jgi:hypothetical protein